MPMGQEKGAAFSAARNESGLGQRTRNSTGAAKMAAPDQEICSM